MNIPPVKATAAAVLLLAVGALAMLAYLNRRGTDFRCGIGSGTRSAIPSDNRAAMPGAGGGPHPPWHAVFAPLPEKAVPKREPFALKEDIVKPEFKAIAGWSRLVLNLSDGCGGNRMVLVLLDADSRPISFSDSVLYRSARYSGFESVVEYRHENVGGRIEQDGTFLGTRVRTEWLEGADGRPVGRETKAARADISDAANVKAFTEEMIRRAPRQPASPQ